MVEEENQETVEGEQTEFGLTEDEINEWIIKLTELKFHKNSIELEIDDENNLLINFQEDSEEEEEEAA
jgi:hypothetical protein